MLSAAVKKNYLVENATYFINQRKSTKILDGAGIKKAPLVGLAQKNFFY